MTKSTFIETKVGWFDHFVFKWLTDQLRDADIETVCSFYVQNLVFKNQGYLERIMAEYKLPSDFLKLHKRIIELADMPYEELPC